MEHGTLTTQARSMQGRGILLVALSAIAIIPVAAVFAAAQIPSVSRPMHVQAETTSLDSSAQSVLFSGHVHMDMPACRVSGDTLRLNHGGDLRNVKTARADGDVRVERGSRWFTGKDALLDTASRTIVLTGSPTMHELSETNGTKITIHLDSDRNVIE
jgi:lipopolysaccharide export system protein LptA